MLTKTEILFAHHPRPSPNLQAFSSPAPLQNVKGDAIVEIFPKFQQQKPLKVRTRRGFFSRPSSQLGVENDAIESDRPSRLSPQTAPFDRGIQSTK